MKRTSKPQLYNEKFQCKDGSPVSRIVLGTMYFGTRIDENRAHNLIEQYLKLGGNQLDTARAYANWLTGEDGASERVIGDWMTKHGGREKIFLGTKAGLMPRGYNKDRANLSVEHLREELSQSLELLRTNYLDVWWLHRDETDRSVEEIIDTCNIFFRQGKIRYLGASNWSLDRIEQANKYAEKSKQRGFSMSQIQCSLAACTPERWGDSSIVCMDKLNMQKYKNSQFPLYAYSAQAGGYYSILEKGEKQLSEDIRQKYDYEENRKRAEIIREIGEKNNIAASAFVLHYVLSRYAETFFIMGSSNTNRLIETFEEINTNIPASVWEKVENC